GKIFSSDRQGESELAAFSRFAFDPDLAAVHFDESSRQRQTESRAFALLGVIAAGLAEFFEDRLLIFSGDADAGVGDRHDYRAIAQRRFDFDRAALGREFDCVGEQVDQNLLHLALVAGEVAEALVYRSLEFDAVAARPLAHQQ